MAWTSWTIRGHLISGSVEQSFHCQSRLFLHPWEDVAVDVHRDGDAGMTQSFAHDLRVYASRQGQRRKAQKASLIFHLYLNQGRLDVHAPEKVSLAPNSCSLLVIMAKAMGVLPAAVAVTLRAARP